MLLNPIPTFRQIQQNGGDCLRVRVVSESLENRLSILESIVAFSGVARLLAFAKHGNGMQYQRAGLQWAQDNIAAFGGDPTKVITYELSIEGIYISFGLMTHTIRRWERRSVYPSLGHAWTSEDSAQHYHRYNRSPHARQCRNFKLPK
jgi:hypothetical protein